MGNLGCFQDKTPSPHPLVSLKLPTIDQPTSTSTLSHLSTLPLPTLLSHLYTSQLSISSLISTSLLPPTTTIPQKTQALSQIFTQWNQLSLVIEGIKTVEVEMKKQKERGEKEEREREEKRVKSNEGIHMVLVRENRELKGEVDRLREDGRKILEEYRGYKGKADEMMWEVKDALAKGRDDWEKKEKSMGVEIAELKKVVESQKMQQVENQQLINKNQEEIRGKLEQIEKLQNVVKSLEQSQALNLQQISTLKQSSFVIKEELEVSSNFVIALQQKLLESENQNESTRALLVETQEINKELLARQKVLQEEIARQEAERNKEIEKEKENKEKRDKELEQEQKQQELPTTPIKLHSDAQYQHTLQQNSALKDKILEMQSKIHQLLSQQPIPPLSAQIPSHQLRQQQLLSTITQQSNKNLLLQQQILHLQTELNQREVTEEMINKFVKEIRGLKDEKEELQRELDGVSEEKMKVMAGVMSQLEGYKKGMEGVEEVVAEKTRKIGVLEGRVKELEGVEERVKGLEGMVEEGKKEREGLIEEGRKEREKLVEEGRRDREELIEEGRKKEEEWQGRLEESKLEENTKWKQELEEQKKKLNQIEKQNETLSTSNSQHLSTIHHLETQIQQLTTSATNLTNQISLLESANLTSQTVATTELSQKHAHQISLLQSQISSLTSKLNSSLESQPQTSQLQSQLYFYFLSLTILPLSEIVQEFPQKQQFKELFVPLNLANSKLLYRASERGFRGFWDVCEGREGDVVVVVKAGEEVFGGYCKGRIGEEGEGEGFLFSLTRGKKWRGKGKVGIGGMGKGKEGRGDGPAFGKDLVIVGNGGSSEIGEMFESEGGDTVEELVGKGKFEVDEYEVYMLWFS